jgi:hypothetical protein
MTDKSSGPNWMMDAWGALTLRDRFAMAAMSLLAVPSAFMYEHAPKASPEARQAADRLSRAAYAIADAMLAERDK